METNETFTVEADVLVRSVVPRRGTPYRHTCTRETLATVAHCCDEQRSVVLTEVVDDEALPSSQAAVALAFLKERGILEPTYPRRHKAASGCVHLDAMTEFFALAERGVV